MYAHKRSCTVFFITRRRCRPEQGRSQEFSMVGGGGGFGNLLELPNRGN